MKRFSAQYIFTNDGPPLVRGIVTTGDDGTIVSVEDTGGSLPELHSTGFYNGIIIPGFVNCHCHTELSYMHGKIAPGTGLGGFLSSLTGLRSSFAGDPLKAIEAADRKMSDEGVVLCADICNSTHSFSTKQKSRIRYISLLEVFGIDPGAAEKRMNDIEKVALSAGEHKLEWYIVPHSVYSVSAPLFRLIRDITKSNRVTSVHFIESEDEKQLVGTSTGNLMDAYRHILNPSAVIMPVADHVSAVTEEITSSGNLILVHNTFISADEVEKLKSRKNLFYCLCPGSNRFISNSVPPARLLKDKGCEIAIGTDSLSSNDRLDMVHEIRILQEEFPDISLEILVKWATLGGAKALSYENEFGRIKPGTKPGLVLISDADLNEMKLLPSSKSVRLI
ncbi:MAG TPA: amidohydrolase family protein [Bacteroidales bacterium]|nr:amidohydrolase family protein [Bacteroidales bacterium]